MVAHYDVQRQVMAVGQIEARGIRDPFILEAFRKVPREAFVPPAFHPQAFGDHPLPIGHGQTISQPYVVALMIEAARIAPGMRVLEVGAGSGYAAALIGQIAERVVAVERLPELAREARERMQGLGYANVAIVEGDGSLGWPTEAPFDAILVAASGQEVPGALVDQLAPGGTLVMPVGEQDGIQQLVKLRKSAGGRVSQERLGGVRFVPLIGEGGGRGAR